MQKWIKKSEHKMAVCDQAKNFFDDFYIIWPIDFY